MQLPPKRKVRKQAQIQSLLRHATRLLPLGGHAVEFCCGGGYVGLALAALRPDASVLLTDMNSISLAFAKERMEKLGLSNVKILRCELSDWETAHVRVPAFASGLPAFDLGLALHACGTATDSVGRICTKARAGFVLSPCCYGFIQHAAQLRISDNLCGCGQLGQQGWGEADVRGQGEPSLTSTPSSTFSSNSDDCRSSVPTTHLKHMYPLSQRFHQAGWELSWYPRLCRTADRTFWSHDDRATAFNSSGQRAMRLVDTDRLLHFAASGYTVSAHFMTPRDASPKNHILVGARCSPAGVVTD
jgi:hypothetical protein